MSRRSTRLCVLCVVVLAVCAALAWKWDRTSRLEHEAVERLTKRGFSFTFNETRLAPIRNLLAGLVMNPRLGQRVRTAHFAGDLSTLGDLSDLALLSELSSLTLIEVDEAKDNRSVVDDAFLEPVRCELLEELVVTTRSGLTDQFLSRFFNSAAIQALIISNSLVTDIGLAHLRGCRNLSGIDVEGCAVTNTGVEAVIGLPSLNRLFLDRTRVDSNVIQILSRSSTLEYAYLCGTAVTVADAIAFTKGRSLLMRVGDPMDPYEVQLGEASRLSEAGTDVE